jgi:hypothetical protein
MPKYYIKFLKTDYLTNYYESGQYNYFGRVFILNYNIFDKN